MVSGSQDNVRLEVAPPPFLVIVVLPLQRELFLLEGGVESLESARLKIRASLTTTVVMLGPVLDILELVIMTGSHERAHAWDVGAAGERLLHPGFEIVFEDAGVTDIDWEEARVCVGALTDLKERLPERPALVVLHCWRSSHHSWGWQSSLSFQQHPNGTKLVLADAKHEAEELGTHLHAIKDPLERLSSSLCVCVCFVHMWICGCVHAGVCV